MLGTTCTPRPTHISLRSAPCRHLVRGSFSLHHTYSRQLQRAAKKLNSDPSTSAVYQPYTWVQTSPIRTPRGAFAAWKELEPGSMHSRIGNDEAQQNAT